MLILTDSRFEGEVGPISERRNEKRHHVETRVWCEGDDFTMMLHTLNLSRNGLFVRTSTPCAVDDRFRITIEEIGAVADVRVRWVRQETGNARSGMALEILQFSSGAQAYETFLEQSTHRSGEYNLGLSLSDRPPKSGPPPRG